MKKILNLKKFVCSNNVSGNEGSHVYIGLNESRLKPYCVLR